MYFCWVKLKVILLFSGLVPLFVSEAALNLQNLPIKTCRMGERNMWYLQKCIEWQHYDVFHGSYFKYERKFNIICNYYFHFLYPRLSTFHQQYCFMQSTLLSVISSRWQTKRSLTFTTRKIVSVRGSDFKSFSVLFDCTFVIARQVECLDVG